MSNGVLGGGASCSGNTCIATGFYNDGTTNRPLLALSHDAGASWTYPSAITSTQLPVTFHSGILNGGASCSGTTCIAIGYYNDGTVNRPLLALSEDGGFSWTYPTSISSTALPSPFNMGSLNGGASI